MGVRHHGADECTVLPVIDEEAGDESGEGSQSPEMMAERRKAAIVSRMRELLRRAAAAQSAHTKLRRSTVATANKWKRVVGRIQNRLGGHQRVVVTLQDDGMGSSVSSISSSKSSLSWDAAAETSGVIRLSCTSSRSDDDEMRMAHWVTTDSDFVVLEL